MAAIRREHTFFFQTMRSSPRPRLAENLAWSALPRDRCAALAPARIPTPVVALVGSRHHPIQPWGVFQRGHNIRRARLGGRCMRHPAEPARRDHLTDFAMPVRSWPRLRGCGSRWDAPSKPRTRPRNRPPPGPAIAKNCWRIRLKMAQPRCRPTLRRAQRSTTPLTTCIGVLGRLLSEAIVSRSTEPLPWSG